MRPYSKTKFIKKNGSTQNVEERYCFKGYLGVLSTLRLLYNFFGQRYN